MLLLGPSRGETDWKQSSSSQDIVRKDKRMVFKVDGGSLFSRTNHSRC